MWIKKTLCELLELAKDAARKARKMNALAMEIDKKYKKFLDEFRQTAVQKDGVTEQDFIRRVF